MLFGVISPCIILPCPFQKIFSSFFQFGQVLREYTWHLVPYPHRQSRKRMMNTLGGGGLRIWNFQGYQRNSMCNFGGLIKIEVEFPRVTKKCGISRGLCFWPWNFQGIEYNFVEYPRVELVKKRKIPGGVSKKYILNPPSPCLDLFWNSPISNHYVKFNMWPALFYVHSLCLGCTLFPPINTEIVNWDFECWSRLGFSHWWKR